MNEKFLTMNEIERLMASSLDGAQMKRLHVVLSHCLIDESDFPSVSGKYSSNQGLLEAFLGANGSKAARSDLFATTHPPSKSS